MIKKISLFIGVLLITTSLFSQDAAYVKPESNIYYNGFVSFPTTRTLAYNLGVEREQITKGNTSFSIAVGISAFPTNTHTKGKSFVFSAFIQPFHIITGGKKWKFESGISASYLDANLFNNPDVLTTNREKMFCGNLFIGSRYCPTKRISIHGGYVPRYILGGNMNYYKKFFHGFELSLFYMLK